MTRRSSKTDGIDFGGRQWSAVTHEHHLEWAGNPNFPDYMRVVFVAYGRHAANGHARLDRGDLARYLVRKNGVIPDRRQVWSAMNKAIRLGYLVEGSRAECLIVNADHIQKAVGDPDAPCRRDHSIRTPKAVPGRGERGRFQSDGDETCHSERSVGDEHRHSEASVGDEDRHSTLSPSLSSVVQPVAATTIDQRPRRSA